MNEFKLKAYIADKVNDIFEKFIYKTCQQVYRRRISENDYHWSVIWNDACYHKIGFRFMDESIPNRVMIYEFDGSLINTNCFVWGYPSVLAEIPSHNTMENGSLIKELWDYIHWILINDPSIVNEYREFIKSIHQDEQSKRALNSWYGMLSSKLYVETAQALSESQRYEETKRANILKALSEALGMPIITSFQWDKYPGQEDDINCILNGPKKYNKEENNMIIPGIKNVFFNEMKRTTTVVFLDHTSVIVKCTDNDEFYPEMGLAMAIARRYFGSRTKLKKAVDKWVATSAPKNEQLRKKAARKAEKEAAKVEHFKAQSESYME